MNKKIVSGITIILLISVVVVFQGIHDSVSALNRDALIGSWKLVSVTMFGDNGERINNPFGVNPTGILIYTPEGRMAALLSNDGRKPFSVADWLTAPLEEKAGAITSFMAYSGRYTVTGDKVIHKVEVASVQNWVNTELIRSVKLEGDKLTLTAPPTLVNGKNRTFTLVWERTK